jgi:homopolymeric O-antigen transport system ATP-binding protein
MRRIQQLKRSGVTIVFVSHDLNAVRNLAERAIWMEHGRVRLEGKTDEIVSEYLSVMVNRGRKETMAEEAMGKALPESADLTLSEEALARIPNFITEIANVDHRHGNGKAIVRGIGVFTREGYPATTIVQGDRICVRVSVEFRDDCQKPNVGFVLRNRFGEDVTGTNATFEGIQLPSGRTGDLLTVDFVLDLPLFQQGFYYFSPAVADGMLNQYDVCDWVDNACVIEIVQKTTTYGYMRVPTNVSAFVVSANQFKAAALAPAPDDLNPLRLKELR